MSLGARNRENVEPELSVIIPCFNEDSCIKLIYQEVLVVIHDFYFRKIPEL